MAPLRAHTNFLATAWTKAVFSALLALLVAMTPVGAWLELQLSDLRESVWPASTELSPVTVLAIDEATLDAIGPWPWPRDKWQAALRSLHTHYSPLVVALDLVFPPGPSADADARLARQMSQRPIVLGQLVLPKGSPKGLWQGQALGEGIEGFVPDSLARASGTLANSPVIARSAAAGHINALLDSDGVLRRYVPAVCWQAQCSVSLGLATVGRAFAQAGWQVTRESRGGARLSLQGLDHLSVPLVQRGGFQIPWQRYHAIPVASLGDVVSGKVDPKIINDRVLLVGSTAPGLADHVVTPVLTQMPGVMAHAVIASAIIESRIPVQPAWAWGASGLLYAMAALAALARPWRYLQQVAIAVVAVVAMGLLLAAAYHLFDLIIPGAFALLAVALLTIAQLVHRLSQVNHDLIRRMTAYLPGPLVKGLSRNVEPAPQLAWSTLLCADTVAYTAASQSLAPDELARWVNTGLDIVIRLIERHGGVIDNIAGDGLMAYWDQGSAEQQANEALKTAMAACRALRAASASLQSSGLPPLDMGMGLHAGPLLAGSYGAGRQRRYTVHGEAANLAQRIEKATRLSPYRLLMSHTLAFIQTQYHAVSTDFPLTVGNASVPLYTITRKIPRRTT